MTEELRTKTIKTASWISIGGNAFLAISKIVAALFAGSLSVLGDGIDSTSDVLISIMTLIIATIIAKPPTLKFPYGYAKAETTAANALSFIVFFAGAQLAIASIRKFIVGGSQALPDKYIIVVVVISIVGKLLLSWQQYRVGKKVKSNMLIANAKNMQGDVLISTSVLVGLVFSHILKMPILDTITALLVSFWIFRVAIKIFIETNTELMDGNVAREVYEEVFHIAECFPQIMNPHRMRIRKIGPKKMINIDIEVEGNLSISEAHRIAHNLEDEIKARMEDVFDVAIHVEPKGDHLEEKELGISKEVLGK
jgi:cation diffusion facilitator family transporter